MISKQNATNLFKKANVNMVGKGKDKIFVGVSIKKPLSALASFDVVPSKIDGVPTDVIQTGHIRALIDRTKRERPCPGGMSIGHYAITAGTLGGIVRNQDNLRLILSNNHVLANSNDCDFGDAILQPGPYDGGTIDDKIATLEDWIPIDFGDGENGGQCPIANLYCWIGKKFASMAGRSYHVKAYSTEIKYNLVDAALAMPVNDSDVLDEILGDGFFFRPTLVGDVELDDIVYKSGRTTGLTKGKVSAIGAYIQVGYGGGKTAYFEDQIIVSNIDTPFIQGGDSGSWGVNYDKTMAVGLCFAGSDQLGVMNRMINVFEAFGYISLS